MIPNSEQGRISELLQKTQRCVIQENLARARAFQQNCTSCTTNVNSTAITENAYLQNQLSCYTYVKPPVPPESTRIATLIQNVLAKESDPLNATTRFVDYAPTVFPFPCPPIDPNIFNGSLPKPAQICPALLNSPLNPVLPA